MFCMLYGEIYFEEITKHLTSQNELNAIKVMTQDLRNIALGLHKEYEKNLTKREEDRNTHKI